MQQRTTATALCAMLLTIGWISRAHAEQPPAGPRSGTLQGTILDSASGRAIAGATVEVVGLSDADDRTDLDGKFVIVIPAGEYSVRVSAPIYEGLLLENVQVTSGQVTYANGSLSARVDSTIEVVEVVADVTAATEATQLLKRRMAPTVSDNLGAESISRTPDSNAAEVVTRMPAVTIKDDKFIVIRGLGERYSSALLNGSRLPSTDPNKRVVPLDLFPAGFIESLSIVKSYTPDLPGDFAGGLVDIQLADPPARFTYTIGSSMGFNTATTFQGFDTYDGTPLDWFGFGEDYRSLPGKFGSEPSENTRGPTTPQMQSFVQSLHKNWNLHSTTAPPNFGINGSVGNTFGPFGFNLAAEYGTKHQVRRHEVLNAFQNRQLFDEGLGSNFVYDRSVFETKLGAILTTTYELSPSHKFGGRGLYNRKSTDEVLDGRGIDSLFDSEMLLFPTEQAYTVDQLGFGQIQGRHHWSFVDVDWRASWAPSLEDQPDNKFLTYQLQDGAPSPELNFKSPSTLRAWSRLDEFLQDYAIDFAFPFATGLPFTDAWSGLPAELKTGLAYSLRNRSFAFRRFATDAGGGVGQIDRSLAPDQILIAGNYGAFSSAPLNFRETTRRSDRFDATQEIAAAYGMLELPILPETLRLIGGARVEYSYIQAEGVGILPPEPFNNFINDLDPLPGVSLIYSPLEDMKLLAGFSQTVSRPEFRELTPTQFPTAPGERTFQGNPNLITADITSWDLRWDWFFSPLELASASFFYKDLVNPIEIVQIPETSNLLDTAINADEATVWGFELEGRKNFNFLVPYVRRWEPARGLASALADLQISVNSSIVTSEVSGLRSDAELGERLVPTNETRALVGQAPFTVNAALEYEHFRWGTWRLLYNTAGRTIAAGGVDIQPENPAVEGLPDIYQERRDQLDLIWVIQLSPFGTPVDVKFAIENLLNDDYLETQGSQTTHKYRTGLTFNMGLSYTF